jgi:hypothetical protein
MPVVLVVVVPVSGVSEMSVDPQEITGGKSVYCFNQKQLEGAFRLYAEVSEAGDQLRAAVDRLEQDLTRNQRAALAFVLIDRLSKTIEE